MYVCNSDIELETTLFLTVMLFIISRGRRFSYVCKIVGCMHGNENYVESSYLTMHVYTMEVWTYRV